MKEGKQDMGAEENKAVAARALESVWSVGGGSTPEDCYTADFVGHQATGTAADQSGLKALTSFIETFHKAFPDFRDSVDRQLADGEFVVTQFTSTGTHRGEFMGVAATGQRAEWSGIEIARISDGKIAENWVSWDRYGMLRQIGALS